MRTKRKKTTREARAVTTITKQTKLHDDKIAGERKVRQKQGSNEQGNTVIGTQ
jgi:hypothetical protein